MYKISTLNKISPVGLSRFNEEYIITEKMEEADGILVRSQDMHEMEFSEKLKAVARAGAGVNNIPLDRCAEKGIVVFNTPGANANAVKELVICGLLLAARNVPDALQWAGTLTEDVSKAVEKGKSQFAGHEIAGKTLGVVGLGAIGRKVAAAAKALGMEIAGYDPYYVSGGEGISVYTDIEEMLGECDYVTLHLPANDSTKGMFDRRLLGAMKEGTVLLNFSRDKLVNDMDLAAAIETGKISRYVTDFPNNNLVGRKNVILIPHLGASTQEAEDNCAVMAADEIRDYFENGNIINSVNFPKLDMGPLEKGIRCSFMVKDMENPASDILGLLSSEDVQVSKVMASRRDDGISYVLAEIASQNVPSLLFQGENGAKIIRYRAIER
ncbi:MAG: 3-phosphoglycerate dehydrogenase [Anaerovoracaceae bacterium]|nr:3-phosphoglycerate dehydrogenase [Anaerovoracaceae bacterium]